MSTNLTVSCSIASWPLVTPFKITGYLFEAATLLYVTIEKHGVRGQGEGAGVYYFGETGESMLAQVESVRGALEAGCDRQQLRSLLPAGGARNAIDCALWDLEAKQSGRSIWDMTGITPALTKSFCTVGIGTPADMAKAATGLDSSNIKVKLDGEQAIERISAVRSARPDATIVVDVNQGWNFAQLVDLAPKFAELDIAMIEQPLPRGDDEELEGYSAPPVTLCADESCLDTSEFEQAARRYQMINIKLDKTGGLTEALDLARLALDRNIQLMVGNMMGTSLAMAPGFVIAQLCRYVDLDGALYFESDRDHPMHYANGILEAPSAALWG